MSLNKRIIQYEVWKECHNHCKFCFLHKDILHTPDEVKLGGIHNAINQITDDIKNKRIDGVGVIGGDFWQGEITTEEIRTEFFKLMDLCFTHLKNGDINEVWLSATLTIGDQKDLYRALDMYNEMIPDKEKEDKRLWICTSYDTIGRFHSQKMLDSWKYHMKNIGEKYPKVFKNTSFIITNDLVKKTLSGEFDFRRFEEEFGTNVYMKTPSHYFEDWEEGKRKFNKIVGDFFLERKPTIEFLQKLNETVPELLNKIMNNDLRANVLVGHSNDGDFDVMIRDQEDKHKNISVATGGENAEKAQIMACGHEKQYKCYIDSDKCFMCDLQRLFKVL